MEGLQNQKLMIIFYLKHKLICSKKMQLCSVLNEVEVYFSVIINSEVGNQGLLGQ